MEGEKKTKERELREGGEGIKKRVRVKKKGGGKKDVSTNTERRKRRGMSRRERPFLHRVFSTLSQFPGS